MWEQLKRVVKKNGAIVLFGSQPFTSALVMRNPKMFRYEIIWEKERPTNFVQLNRMIGKVHESISIFYRQQPIYNPIKEKSIQQNNNKNMKSQVSVMNTVESSTITAKISKSR